MDSLNFKITSRKPRNYVAKDLREPKYRMRVASSKKQYNRSAEKQNARREYENAYA